MLFFTWPLCFQSVTKIAGTKESPLLIIKDNLETFSVVNPNCACLLNTSV